MEIFEDYYDEADAVSQVNTETAKNLSGLVRNLRKVEDQIEDAEQHVKELKRAKQKLSTETIPALMDEMGLERLDVDGMTVQRKLIVHASIPKDRTDEAHAWLRENKYDDIIKNDVVCSFSMGQDNLAKSIIADLEDRGVNPQAKTHIHPMTLKSWVKDRIEAGKDIDLEMFGAFVGTKATTRKV